MGTHVLLPFCHIINDEGLLTAIWNEPNSKISCNMTDFPVLNILDSEDVATPTNWNMLCKYLTLNELLNEKSNCHNLSITHINTRSLKKNFDSLKTYLSHFTVLPKFIAITETWLKENDESSFQLPNFKFLSNPRKDRTGGGVGLYICNSLSFVIRTDLMQILGNVCEYIAIETQIDKDHSFIVISIYRPPNCDLQIFNHNFKTLLEKLEIESNHKSIIVAGDLNIDLIKSNHHKHTEDFINILLAAGFLPTVTRPTSLTEFSSTLLDNIYVNCFQFVHSSSIVFDDTSDHLPVIANFNFNVSMTSDQSVINKRSFKSENFQDFYNKLEVNQLE